VTTEHFHLDIFVDFDVSSVGGYQTLNLTALKDGVNQVVLDYQGMEIIGVEEMDQETNAFWVITGKCASYEDQALGNALIIPLRESKYHSIID
jgi:hypothetical protein